MVKGYVAVYLHQGWTVFAQTYFSFDDNPYRAAQTLAIQERPVLAVGTSNSGIRATRNNGNNWRSNIEQVLGLVGSQFAALHIDRSDLPSHSVVGRGRRSVSWHLLVEPGVAILAIPICSVDRVRTCRGNIRISWRGHS